MIVITLLLKAMHPLGQLFHSQPSHAIHNTTITNLFTCMRDEWVVSGCDGDVGDADLMKLVRVPGSSVVLFHTRVPEYWSSETLIKLRH